MLLLISKDQQYEVLVDGSRRLTTRNRRHLRKIPDPVDIDKPKKEAEKAEVEEEEDEDEYNTQQLVPVSDLPVPSPVQTSAPEPLLEPIPKPVQIPDAPGPDLSTSLAPVPTAVPAPESPVQEMPLRRSTRE